MPQLPRIYKTIEEDTEFAKCVAFVLQMEGGYVNHPKDPGGETKFGISKRAFPHIDIKRLKIQDAKVIYYKHYWLFTADQLGWPLNLVVFDTAVNCGGRRAKQWLNESKEDWKKYLEIRRVYYYDIVKRRPSQEVFLNGWLNRINEVKKFIEEQNAKD